jgi:hypothetical protein
MNKNDIIKWLQQGAEMVRAQEADAIETLGVYREIATALKKYIEPIDAEAIAKAKTMGMKEIVRGDYRFRFSEGAKGLDYSKVDAIVELEAQIEIEKTKSKQATELLWNMKGRLDPETGYVIDSQGVVIGQPAALKPTKESLTIIKER